MTVEDIEAILAKNPDIPFETLRTQAIQKGTTSEEFDKAWSELVHREKKKGERGRINIYYGFFLVALSLIGFDGSVWHFVLKDIRLLAVILLGGLAVLASTILTMHLAARLAGGSGDIFKTTKLGIFIFSLVYVLRFTEDADPTLEMLMSFGSVLAALLIIGSIAKTHNIGLIRLSILLMLQGIMMYGVFVATFGADYLFLFIPINA